MSVLLPQPLGPRMQEKRRERNRCEKRSSATTPFSPPQICVTSSATTSIASPLRLLMHALWHRRLCAVPQARDVSHPPRRREPAAQPGLVQDRACNPLAFGDHLHSIFHMREGAVSEHDLAVDQHG